MTTRAHGGRKLGNGSYGAVLTLNNDADWKLYFKEEGKVVLLNKDVSFANFIDTYAKEYVVKVFRGKNDSKLYEQSAIHECNIMYSIRKKLPLLSYTIIPDFEPLYFTTSDTNNEDDHPSPNLLYLLYKRMNNSIFHYFDVNKTAKLSPAHEPKEMTMHDLDNVVGSVMGFLESLHEGGLYHNDIKPDNILYKYDNDDITFAVGDYGIVSEAGDKVLYQGTPHYMSPFVLISGEKNKAPEETFKLLIEYWLSKFVEINPDWSSETYCNEVWSNFEKNIRTFTVRQKLICNDYYAAYMSFFWMYYQTFNLDSSPENVRKLCKANMEDCLEEIRRLPATIAREFPTTTP